MIVDRTAVVRPHTGTRRRPHPNARGAVAASGGGTDDGPTGSGHGSDRTSGRASRRHTGIAADDRRGLDGTGHQQSHRREAKHSQQSKHPNRANLRFILKQTREPRDAGLGRQSAPASGQGQDRQRSRV